MTFRCLQICKKNPRSFDFDDPVAIRLGMISYLRTHRAWYQRSLDQCNGLAIFFSVSITVLSFVAAVIAAIGDVGLLSKYAGIVLPSLVGLFSAMLAQFRLREKAALRDQGRIGIESLICRAHLIPVGTAAQALTAAMALRAEAHEIERLQSSLYFRASDKDAQVSDQQPPAPAGR